MTFEMTKDDLRVTAKRSRAQAALQASDASARLQGQFIRGLCPKPGSVVAGYLPIGDEIDPTLLMSFLDIQGHALALPVVIGEGQALAFRLWEPGIALEDGPLGTRHPASSEPVVPTIILTPLLAFDRQGYRLGWGGGYYDRTLAGLDAITVGLAYAAQEVEAVPHDTFDQSLDWIVTEKEAIKIT